MPAQLSAKIDAVGGDVAKLTSDPAFMKGLRNVTIGLGAVVRGGLSDQRPPSRHDLLVISVQLPRYRAYPQMSLMASIATAAMA